MALAVGCMRHRALRGCYAKCVDRILAASSDVERVQCPVHRYTRAPVQRGSASVPLDAERRSVRHARPPCALLSSISSDTCGKIAIENRIVAFIGKHWPFRLDTPCASIRAACRRMYLHRDSEGLLGVASEVTIKRPLSLLLHHRILYAMNSK